MVISPDLGPIPQSKSAVIFKNILIGLLAFIISFDSMNVFGLISPGNLILNGLKIVLLFFLLTYIYTFRQHIQNRDILLVLVLLPFFWIYFAEGNPVIATLKCISRFGSTITFLLIPNEWKKRVVHFWFNFFVIGLIPGLIIHILKLTLGIDFPIIELTNILGEKYDSHFLLYFYDRWNYIRFNSLYDEPGVVGTFVVLFLLFYHEPVKKWKKATLWLGGIATLSFYFFVSIPMILSLKMLHKGKKLSLLLFILLGIVLMTNSSSIIRYILSTTNQSPVYQDLIFQAIKSRISFDEKSDGPLEFQTNRVHADTYNFEKFINDDWVSITFGNVLTKGREEFTALTTGGLGQEIFLYDYGILLYLAGFLFMFLLAYVPWNNGWLYTFVAFILICLCFYQRPFIYRADFLCIIYMGSLSYASMLKRKKKSLVL